MLVHGVFIEDTFAEAFRMWASRLIVTAIDEHWVKVAANVTCGYGTSVIGCDAEAGIERMLSPDETPDGRPGASLLFFGFNVEGLRKAVPNRTGQCLLTCPTTAVFDGMPDVAAGDDGARIDLGKRLRFFGDGHQKSKQVVIGREEVTERRSDGVGERSDEETERRREEVTEGGSGGEIGRGGDVPRRFWRVPVMDGEFTCEETVGAMKAIAGGNILVCGRDQRSTLDATRAAVEAVARRSDVITPFPGGIVRSGSKVGSRYKGMFASTNDAYCPTLRSRVTSSLGKDIGCVYEIVIDGLSVAAISAAMRAAIEAACASGAMSISAGNYGGKLGKFHFKLREVMA